MERASKGPRLLDARLLLVLALMQLALVLLSQPAVAQSDEASNQAAAQALFESARELMKEGRHAEACPKLAESHRLAPALGTRFNLAECYARIGRLASAWAHYVGVADAAARTAQPEREAFARERAESLKPRLSRLRIVVKTPPKGLTITRDGVDVGAAQWGEALPVDAGSHQIEAKAPGYQAWSTAVDIIGEATLTTLRVPALQPIVPEPPPPAPVPPPPTLPVPAPTPTKPAPLVPTPVPAPDTGGLHPLQVGALIAGGAGLVGLGIGTGFGIFAKSKKDQAAPHCPRPDACFAEGTALIEQAQTAADVSTASFAIGGALAVAGVVMWLATPSASTGSGGRNAGYRIGIAPARHGIGVRLHGVW